MQFWIGSGMADPLQALPIARKAEDLGFPGMTVADHMLMPRAPRSKYPYNETGEMWWPRDTPWPDPWVTIGALAAVTTRLRFASTVYILPLRNVFVTAKAVATAAYLANDRVVLGAGVGWMADEFEQLREDFETRGRRTDEIIEVLRALWRGGMVEFHGRFHDFDGLQISPVPSRPVPIWIGGETEAAFRRAARLGDGYVGIGRHSLDEVLAIAARVNELRREAGRGLAPFEFLFTVTEPERLTPGDLRRLEEGGIRQIMAGPWRTPGSPRTVPLVTLEEKLAAMERFAEEYLDRTPAESVGAGRMP